MIFKINFDIENNRQTYRGNDKEFEGFIDMLKPFNDFSFECYRENTNSFLFCLNEYSNTRQPKLLDYGYGLTIESLEKYLAKYKEDESNSYLIEAGLMSFNNEKPWKCGYYIDREGKDTGLDYEDIEGIESEMEHADVKNCFITFSVFDMNFIVNKE